MTRLALVTGTSRGIGTAVALELLGRGWRVQGLARGEAPAALGDKGYEHRRLDLADLSALEHWFEGEFAPRLEQVGATRVGLVNNAALLAPVGPATALVASELANHLAVNVVAPTWLAGALLRRVPRAAVLRVVNLSSGAATSAYAGWSAYCAGKAALAMTGEVLALESEAYPELAGRDLSVVTYAPHVVATRMQEELRGTPAELFPLHQRFVDLEQSGALVTPEGPAAEIADLLERDDLPRHMVARYEPD